MTTIWDPDPEEETRPFVVLDLEASGLGKRSFPIEVGVAYVQTGEVRSWLVRPHRLGTTGNGPTTG